MNPIMRSILVFVKRVEKCTKVVSKILNVSKTVKILELAPKRILTLSVYRTESTTSGARDT